MSITTLSPIERSFLREIGKQKKTIVVALVAIAFVAAAFAYGRLNTLKVSSVSLLLLSAGKLLTVAIKNRAREYADNKSNYLEVNINDVLGKNTTEISQADVSKIVNIIKTNPPLYFRYEDRGDIPASDIAAFNGIVELHNDSSVVRSVRKKPSRQPKQVQVDPTKALFSRLGPNDPRNAEPRSVRSHLAYTLLDD